jgi:hypothetical protein
MTRRQWLRLSLALALCAPLALEAAARIGARLRGEPWDGAAARAELLQIVRRLGGAVGEGGAVAVAGPQEGVSLHPFTGYQTEGARLTLAALAVAADRAADAERPLVVVVSGGSLAEQFAAAAHQRLAELLESDPRLAGRAVAVIGLGQPAFKAPQSLSLLGWVLALGIEFDLLLQIDGLNDVAFAADNARHGVHPAFPAVYQWGGLARGLSAGTILDHAAAARAARNRTFELAEDALAGWALASAALGSRALRGVRAAEAEWRAESAGLVAATSAGGADPVTSGPPFAPGNELAIALRAWREQSLALAALCRLHGAAYLHVLQPTLLDAGSKPLAPEERLLAPPDALMGAAITAGYPRLRAELALLAARGLEVLDASRIFEDYPAPLYVDFCHLTPDGSRRLAAALAPRAADALAEATARARGEAAGD